MHGADRRDVRTCGACTRELPAGLLDASRLLPDGILEQGLFVTRPCIGVAIEIVEYDTAWPQRFTQERERIEPHLQPWLAGRIRHVGSTAVPGLAAKPIIDMMAPVANHDAARGAIRVLEGLGYQRWAEDPHRSWRHWFLYPDIQARTHHLYLMEHAEPEVTALLRLRDHLRDHPDAAEDYALAKRRLAAEHRDDREAYTRGKTTFLQALFEAQGWTLPHPR